VNPDRRVVRIAHAYGNSRESLQRALSADVDMIEVDAWYRGGEIYIRHARRLNPFPILYDKVMRGHDPGWAIRFGRYYVRPDFGTLELDEVLEATAGRKSLLLDLKGHYHSPDVDGYVETLVRKIRSHSAEGWVAVCGQTYAVLNRFRKVTTDIELRYSIEKQYQWESFLRKMARDLSVRRVCIAHGFIDAEKARVMEENGVDLYCWTVDSRERAAELVAQGVDGIISNDLGLLERLPRDG